MAMRYSFASGQDDMKKLLITGGAGNVARLLRRHLSPQFEAVRIYDLVAPGDLSANEEAVVGDLNDLSALQAAMAGMDGIVHLAGYPREAPFDHILDANIKGVWNMYEAARRAGITRVVNGSTTHTVGFYPRDATIGPDAPVRPDSRYGLSKVFGEATGQLYADKHGIKSLQIRIGFAGERPNHARSLLIWVSARDLAQLCMIGLAHPDIHNTIVYGISDNPTCAWYDNRNAVRLGYRPQDRASDFYDEAMAAEALIEHPYPSLYFQGDGFAAIEYAGEKVPAKITAPIKRPDPLRIVDLRVTPIAFRDPPLLNQAGVHEPFALRSVIEVETADGRIGLGESYGDLDALGALAKIAPALKGLSPFDLNGLTRAVYGVFGGDPAETFSPKGDKRRASALAAFEVPFLDLQGQVAGRPLHDILGGKCRERVPYSAYLFYKFGHHKDRPDLAPDPWGEGVTHEQIVAQARRMIDAYGFGSIKLKAGVFAPEFEIETLRHLKRAFPGHPLRIDPNGGWSVATTKRLMPQLEGLLEYLEDPVPTLAETGEVATFAAMPLATNMVTVAFGHIPETLRLKAVQVVLSDHHYWGGLRATQQLAQMGRVHGFGISMHSNSHMGISLAAMTHVGATIPNLAYAADTHYRSAGAPKAPPAPQIVCTRRPSAIAAHSRSGVAGMSTWRMR